MTRILVTGSAGHLGEAMCRSLAKTDDDVIGIDIKASPFTRYTGSIADPVFVKRCMEGVDTVYHSATLHKPHVITHSKQDFIDTNISGTENLLQAAVDCGTKRFIFTSTTSVYGHAMRPASGSPAVWVTEDLAPKPKNIYGITKLAAENLCRLAHDEDGLACIVLRTSRFFPEDDDSVAIRSRFSNDNSKANEYLNRRVEIEDVVDAHLAAAARAESLGFGLYIISATSPFTREDLQSLNVNASQVVEKYFADFPEVYKQMGWEMFEQLDRVYVNEKARKDLGWQPRVSFASVLGALSSTGKMPSSGLAAQVGVKGYHDREFEGGPYPV